MGNGNAKRSAEQSCRCRDLRGKSGSRGERTGLAQRALHRRTRNACNRPDPANRLTLFVAEDGAISYDLRSRKLGRSSGKLDLNKPLTNGWADWAINVDKLLPHAEQWMDFIPATAAANASDLPDGVHVRFSRRANDRTMGACWLAGFGSDLAAPIQIAYGWKQIPLPVALELVDFEVKRNEAAIAQLDSKARSVSQTRKAKPPMANAG